MVLTGGGHGDAEELAEAGKLMEDFLAYLTDVVERRRAGPQDDVLSRIIQAAAEGVLDGAERFHLESDEVRDFALFLLIAGNETTRNASGQSSRLIICSGWLAEFGSVGFYAPGDSSNLGSGFESSPGRQDSWEAKRTLRDERPAPLRVGHRAS